MPNSSAPRFATILRRLGSLLPDLRRGGRRSQRVVRPWREDALHSYPTHSITPSRLRGILQQADGGTPAMQFELFGEMLQKWPRLAAVEATRRLALTGLDWEIVPAEVHPTTTASDGATRDSAISKSPHASSDSAANQSPRATNGSNADAADIAAYCTETLQNLDRFRDALDRLARAIGYGIAVAELVWDDGRLSDVVPVPHNRLISDPNESWRLHIRTADDPAHGVPLDAQPWKWIVHRPNVAAGRDFEGGLLRASTGLFIAQHLSFRDWLIYSQVAGMPARIARFEPGTPEDEKARLLRMLENLGTDAVAILSKTVELQLLDVSRSAERPYQPLQDHCNTELTILWLGQHLTTDLRESGSRAAAEVHDRVREDLLVNDIAAEGVTIRRDLLTPLVRARFGPDAPVPLFRRSLVQAVDTRVLADVLSVAVRELKLPVPREWAYRALGIPAPRSGEAILESTNMGVGR